MRRITSLALALAAILPATGFASPTLLVNGSFEQQVQLGAGQWTVLPSFVGWTVDGSSGVEVRNGVAGTAQDGQVFVELDTHSGAFGSSLFDGSTNSWIAQQVQTIAGMHYTLTWFYAPREGVAADSKPIEVLWNGTKVAKSNGSGMGHDAGVWEQFTLDLVGTGGLDTLTFAAVGKADSLGGSLDNVSLVANASEAAAQAVPEPATLALVVSALGAAGLGLRHRRANR